MAMTTARVDLSAATAAFVRNPRSVRPMTRASATASVKRAAALIPVWIMRTAEGSVSVLMVAAQRPTPAHSLKTVTRAVSVVVVNALTCVSRVDARGPRNAMWTVASVRNRLSAPVT